LDLHLNFLKARQPTCRKNLWRRDRCIKEHALHMSLPRTLHLSVKIG